MSLRISLENGDSPGLEGIILTVPEHSFNREEELAIWKFLLQSQLPVPCTSSGDWQQDTDVIFYFPHIFSLFYSRGSDPQQQAGTRSPQLFVSLGLRCCVVFLEELVDEQKRRVGGYFLFCKIHTHKSYLGIDCIFLSTHLRTSCLDIIFCLFSH